MSIAWDSCHIVREIILGFRHPKIGTNQTCSLAYIIYFDILPYFSDSTCNSQIVCTVRACVGHASVNPSRTNTQLEHTGARVQAPPRLVVRMEYSDSTNPRTEQMSIHSGL